MKVEEGQLLISLNSPTPEFLKIPECFLHFVLLFFPYTSSVLHSLWPWNNLIHLEGLILSRPVITYLGGWLSRTAGTWGGPKPKPSGYAAFPKSIQFDSCFVFSSGALYIMHFTLVFSMSSALWVMTGQPAVNCSLPLFHFTLSFSSNLLLNLQAIEPPRLDGHLLIKFYKIQKDFFCLSICHWRLLSWCIILHSLTKEVPRVIFRNCLYRKRAVKCFY